MEFTCDWFSRHIPQWQRWLAPLRGQPNRSLEIGSHEGRSAVWIVENLLTHLDATLTCIDPWPDLAVERRFFANLHATGRRSQVRILRGTSFEWLRELLPEFDFIYIDGHHEGRHVLEDAVLAFRLLRIGGMLIFDDYVYHPATVHFPPRPAIDIFLSLWGDCLERLHQGDQVIVRKTADPQRPPQTYG